MPRKPAKEVKRILFTDEQKVLIREQVKDFYFFVQFFWRQVAAQDLIEMPYIEGICKHVENIIEIKKLLINKPYRTGVSTIVSVLFPAWYWAVKDPSYQFICASFTESLAVKFSVMCRNLIESPAYQELFDVKLSEDQNTKGLFTNTKGGIRATSSPGTGTLGTGANIIIFDDPNDSAQITSSTHRNEVVSYWMNTLITRVNMGKPSAKIVIQQRLDKEDLSGWLLENETGWLHLNLPFEASDNPFISPIKVTNDKGEQVPLWKDERSPGELLAPIMSAEELAQKKKIDPFHVSTQLNQSPSARSGSLYKHLEYVKFDVLDGLPSVKFGIHNVKISDLWLFATTDTAMTAESHSDHSVMCIWGSWMQHLVMVDYWRGKLEAPALLEKFSYLYHQYHCNFIGTEVNGAQSVFVSLMKQTKMTVRGYAPRGCKYDRAVPCWIKTQNKELWLIEQPEILDELFAFGPESKQDDIQDCISMAVDMFATYGLDKKRLNKECFVETAAEKYEKWKNKKLLEHMYN